MKNPTHRGDDDDYRDQKARAETERTETERAEKERADQAEKDRAEKERTGKSQPQGTYGGTVAGRAGAAAPQTAPDPYKTYTLADFANEFTANLPADAAGGDYVAKEGDPWSDPAAHPWAVEGVHDARGWRFTFKDGKFVEAHRFAEEGAPAGASATARR